MHDFYIYALFVILINQVFLFFLSGRLELWRHHADLIRAMRLNNIVFYLTLSIYVVNYCGNCISCFNPQAFCK